MTKRKPKQDGGRIEKVSGKVLFSFAGAAATSLVSLGLHPTLPLLSGGSAVMKGDVKLSALADLFQYYRFTKFRWRLLPTNSELYISGYQPDLSQTLPSGTEDIMALPYCGEALLNLSGTESIPSVPAWNTIPPHMMLQQNVKWWRTRVSGSVDDQFEYQGAASFGRFTDGSQLTGLYVDTEYEIQFKNFISANQTPKTPVESKECSGAHDEEDELVVVRAKSLVSQAARMQPAPLSAIRRSSIAAPAP